MVAVLFKRWRVSLGEWLVTRLAPALIWELIETEYRVATFTVREQTATRTRAYRQLKTRRRLLLLAESVSHAISGVFLGLLAARPIIPPSVPEEAGPSILNRLEVKCCP
jgi:hypothetical protein